MLMYSFNLHLVSAEYISRPLLQNRNSLMFQSGMFVNVEVCEIMFTTKLVGVVNKWAGKALDTNEQPEDVTSIQSSCDRHKCL